MKVLFLYLFSIGLGSLQHCSVLHHFLQPHRKWRNARDNPNHISADPGIHITCSVSSLCRSIQSLSTYAHRWGRQTLESGRDGLLHHGKMWKDRANSHWPPPPPPPSHWPPTTRNNYLTWRAGLRSTHIFGLIRYSDSCDSRGDSTLTQLNTLLFLIDSTQTHLKSQIC